MRETLLKSDSISQSDALEFIQHALGKVPYSAKWESFGIHRQAIPHAIGYSDEETKEQYLDFISLAAIGEILNPDNPNGKNEVTDFPDKDDPFVARVIRRASLGKIARHSEACCLLLQFDEDQNPIFGKNDTLRIPVEKSHKKYQLCQSEAIYRSLYSNYVPKNKHVLGTGFLLEKNILMTAAHLISKCVEMIDDDGLPGIEWLGRKRRKGIRIMAVFDWLHSTPTHLEINRTKNELEAFVEIPLTSIWEFPDSFPAAYKHNKQGQDFGLVRLTLPPELQKRAAFPQYRLSRNPPDGGNQSVFALGHPWGIPQCLSVDGTIQPYAENPGEKNSIRNAFFGTTLDSFTGSSGSPVFRINNSNEHELLGVMCRVNRGGTAHPDLIPTDTGCNQVFAQNPESGKSNVNYFTYLSEETIHTLLKKQPS